MFFHLWVTGWRPNVTGWGGGISVVLHHGSNCLQSRSMDGRMMLRGIISSCQSTATSDTVKRCWSWAYSCMHCSAITSTRTFTFTFLQYDQINQSNQTLLWNVTNAHNTVRIQWEWQCKKHNKKTRKHKYTGSNRYICMILCNKW